MSKLPTGTVTFLFTDIEGSTKLAQEHPDKWESLRERHHAILQSAIEVHKGHVFQVIGDAFCVAFHTAGEALRAAIKIQTDLFNEEWGDAPVKVRMGIHTGEAELQAKGDYHGYLAMSRVQRLMSAAHGGQVLISLATQELVRDELPVGITLRDMGERRLKDLIRPEHMYQLDIANLPAEFPPIKTLDIYAHNLPAQTTSFIGRAKEMAEIKHAMQEHRLVTLTGSGGTGKTRLTLQVAVDFLDHFPDGVWLVELASLLDPELIPQTILSVLGSTDLQGKTPLKALEEFLQPKKILIVLDNCEHLITGAAQTTNTILNAAPNLKILASSREALGVKGELAWHVPSLSVPNLKKLPELDQLTQYESVRLFIDRALLVLPHFIVDNENAPAVAQICYRLDGIPLALELAAARVKMLSVDQISARLDDRFRLLTGGARTALPRQQTLRAMIDWSYGLLSEDERLLLRRLAVFVGGWTLELAEQVCSDEKIDQHQILDLLSKLVDKSLVAVVEGGAEMRYRILETVRQYAREKLFESGEGEKIRDGHLKAFIELAEKAEPEIRGANQLIWLDRLEDEIDNLRTALEWSQEKDKESFLQLASALWRFWSVRAYIADLEWLPQALALTEGIQTVLRARALGRASFVAANHGDIQHARIWAKEAEIASLALDDKPSLIMALSILGDLETDPTQTTIFLDMSLALAREIGDHWTVAGNLMSRGDFFLNRNDLASARSFFEQGVNVARIAGDKRRLAYALGQLGIVTFAQRDAVQAEQWFREAVAQAQTIRDNVNTTGLHGSIAVAKIYLEDYATAQAMTTEYFRLAQTNKALMGDALLIWAWIDLAQGNVLNAIQHLEEGLNLATQTTNSFAIANLLLGLGDALRCNGEFVQATEKFKEALAIINNETLGNAYYCGLGEVMGILAIDQGRVTKGTHLLAAREKLRASVFLVDFLPFMVRERESHIAKAREQLGEEAFNQAWEEGKSMTMEQVIEYILGESNE